MGNFLRKFEMCEQQSASSSGEKKPSPIDFAARKLSQGILAREQGMQENSRESKDVVFHSKGLHRDVAETICKLGNEEVIFSCRPGASKQAQDWLRGKNDVPEPRPVDLAYTVNPYERIGGFGDGANEWVNERLPYLTNDQVSILKTQELLDILFYFHRKERFCEGTLDRFKEEINSMMTELRTRVEKLRQ